MTGAVPVPLLDQGAGKNRLQGGKFPVFSPAHPN